MVFKKGGKSRGASVFLCILKGTRTINVFENGGAGGGGKELFINKNHENRDFLYRLRESRLFILEVEKWGYGLFSLLKKGARTFFWEGKDFFERENF